jgi:diguanylate cyclase (GGDEF)-like protein
MESAPAKPEPFDDRLHELEARLARAERRLQRERVARLEAERLGESGLRKLYEQQEALALLQSVATCANAGGTLEDTLHHALQRVCEFAGWPLGNVYLTSLQGSLRLIPGQITWADDEKALEPFLAATRKTDFLPGRGLPGRVYADGAAAWIDDVTKDGNFPRAPHAEAVGLKAGFAVPVTVGSTVHAVLEFFTHRALPPDHELMNRISQVGTILGRVLERKQAEEKLIFDASHDALTGLPNRLLFLDRLERTVSRHERQPDRNVAVLFIDIDRFKLVNDSLGHLAGDELIRRIAARLAKSLEAQPVRGAPHTLARLGGDEFTVLLEELADDAEAITVARVLLDDLREPFEISGHELHVTASLGIATTIECKGSTETLLRDADLAMYRAKSLGTDHIELFSDALHELALQRLKLEGELRAGLMSSQFELHYQPIVRIGSQELHGFEALLRWRRPDGSLSEPGSFIPMAEQTGLIVPIGTWVLSEACAKMERWRGMNSAAAGLSMSVNVSQAQFAHPDFLSILRETLRSSGLPPTALRIEITESMAVSDSEHAVGILQEIHELGVRVSIDDFGTGYSSLSHLHQLPLDTLKIDKSFVQDIGRNSSGRGIVRTIIDLARHLGLDVIAEGTETRAQVEQLEAMGCGLVQGQYYFAPLPPEDVEALLRCDP